MKFLLLIFSLIFVNCATHAPMSELVMFNKEREVRYNEKSKKASGFAFSGNFQNNEPREDSFDAKSEQDYIGITEGPTLAFSWLDGEDFGFNFSIGSANGMDITLKVLTKSFVTTSISTQGTAQLAYHYRVLNGDSFGASSGLFISRENRHFYSNDNGFLIGPDDSTDMLGVGVKSRFLFTGKYQGSPGISGSVRVGLLPEIEQIFVGFSFSFLTF